MLGVSEKQFSVMKSNISSSIDFSRKGSIDEEIADLIKQINTQDNFVTTSSCSGRVILFSEGTDINIKKKGCHWIFLSHTSIALSDILQVVNEQQGHVILKFEPFIMHVLCRNLDAAILMQSAALESGYRNSGMTVGKKGKITYAVRSTAHLQVPIAFGGNLLVTAEYISHLVNIINEKFEVNKTQVARFTDLLYEKFASSRNLPSIQDTGKEKN